MDERIRVLVVDDHALLAEGLALALRREGLEVNVVKPQSVDTMVAIATDYAPDVILLDLVLGDDGESGLDLIKPLREACGAPVLMVTGVTDKVSLASCLEAGAAGVASKAEGFSGMLERILKTAQGESPLSENERIEFRTILERHRAGERERLAPFRSLTRREQEVLAALMDGKSAQEIADESFVELGTVRSQIKAIRQKLGVGSQLAAVAAARRAGWTLDTARAGE